MTGALRLAFVVESGTDVRLADELSTRFRLTVLARRIPGGREISQALRTRPEVIVGPASIPRFAWRAFSWVLRNRARLDAVLVQGYGPTALACNMAGRLAGLETLMLVCSPVEAYYACRRLEPAGRRYRRHEALAIAVLARLNARLGRRYVVLSPYLESVVRGHGARGPVDVIPVYGVDTAVFTPPIDPRPQTRHRLGLPPDAALIFFSSRIAPEKDPDTLLEAVARLRAEGRDVRILHLSGGYEDFRARAAARGLGEAVIARDAVPPFAGLADWYRAADVCVQASREEGLGFSPLEALACETPVIAASVGGLRDTIRDGDTGWTYPPGDGDALARAIRSALDQPGEARGRARRGRALVVERFDRERVFNRLADALERRPSTTAHVEAPAVEH